MDHGGVEVHRVRQTNIAATHSTVPIGGLAQILHPSSPFVRNGHQIITTGLPKVQTIAFPLLRTQTSKLMIIFWLLLLIFLKGKYAPASKSECLGPLGRCLIQNKQAFRLTHHPPLALLVLRPIWATALLSGCWQKARFCANKDHHQGTLGCEVARQSGRETTPPH